MGWLGIPVSTVTWSPSAAHVRGQRGQPGLRRARLGREVVRDDENAHLSLLPLEFRLPGTAWQPAFAPGVPEDGARGSPRCPNRAGEQRYAASTASPARSSPAAGAGSRSGCRAEQAEQDRGRRGQQRDLLVRPARVAPALVDMRAVRLSHRSPARTRRCSVQAVSARYSATGPSDASAARRG